MDYASLEVKVSDFWITIRSEHGDVASISIDPETGIPRLGLYDVDGVELCDGQPEMGCRLRVDVLTKTKEPGVALPRYQREPVHEMHIEPISKPQATVKSRNGKSYASSVPRIGENTRDAVLNAIIDSELKHPHAEKGVRETETHRLAQQFKLKPMQIAGVRAALTRGVYDDAPVVQRYLEAKAKGKV